MLELTDVLQAFLRDFRPQKTLREHENYNNKLLFPGNSEGMLPLSNK